MNQVLSSTTPDEATLAQLWSARTAASVIEPKIPSIAPVYGTAVRLSFGGQGAWH